MKKLVSLFIIAMMCVTLALPASAAGFVPSITYKDGPDVDNAVIGTENVKNCVVITSITEARNQNTDIPQTQRDQLLDLYQQINSGEMKLPINNKDYVIRELVDVSLRAAGCIDKHEHEEWLSQAGNTITVDMTLGITSAHDVVIMVYVNDQWVEAERVVNKGNGVFAVTFEELGPVAVCVDSDAQVMPPKTGDDNGSAMLLWGGVLLGSVVAIVILLILFKRSKREEE